jgi:hypothetical protein
MRLRIASSCSAGSPPLSRAALPIAAGAAFAGSVWSALGVSNDGLSLLLVAFALLAAGIAWLDHGADSSKELVLIATLGALAAPLLRGRLALAAFCFVLGLGFSAFMDVWTWLSFYDQHTWQTFVAVHGRGLPFDLAHGIGNVVIALAAGPELRRLLDRYRRRLRAEVIWA